MEISFSILPTGNYHKDFLIRIDNYVQKADTYFFWRDAFGELNDPYEGIKNSIGKYLARWAVELKNMGPGEKVFIPIDFSDEYVNGFEIKSLGNAFEIVYGTVRDTNNLVIRVDENECYTNLTDKPITPCLKFKIGIPEFLNSLRLT
jgi:hypothetical protein